MLKMHNLDLNLHVFNFIPNSSTLKGLIKPYDDTEVLST